MLKQPKFWTTHSTVSVLLSPLAALFSFGTKLHRLLTPPRMLRVPVISIGNVTVGGAGKTPTTIALTQLLQSTGRTPHILSRGYGAHIAAPIRINPSQHKAAEVGDEALLLAQCAPTWVFANRHVSGMSAIAAGADILVCDDALQHHALKKDINIMVIDGAYGVGNGLVLPAGPLRESLAGALKRCDAVILIGDDAHGLCDTINLPVFKASIRPTGDIGWMKDTKVVAFAGIARPQKFYQTLLDLGAVITATYDFPDHHAFTEKELHMLAQGGTMVTTQKDWVRLPSAWQARVKYVPIALDFAEPKALLQWLNDALTS